jgi:hypothetical protein
MEEQMVINGLNKHNKKIKPTAKSVTFFAVAKKRATFRGGLFWR